MRAGRAYFGLVFGTTTVTTIFMQKALKVDLTSLRCSFFAPAIFTSPGLPAECRVSQHTLQWPRQKQKKKKAAATARPRARTAARTTPIEVDGRKERERGSTERGETAARWFKMDANNGEW